MSSYRPVRVQCQRTQGWRAPTCGCGCGRTARYVGRPSRWGNPFSAMDCGRRYPSLTATQVAAFVVNQFRTDRASEHYPDLRTIRAELAGHDLMCWCPLRDAEGNRVPCHADVLLELATGGVV